MLDDVYTPCESFEDVRAGQVFCPEQTIEASMVHDDNSKYWGSVRVRWLDVDLPANMRGIRFGSVSWG